MPKVFRPSTAVTWSATAFILILLAGGLWLLTKPPHAKPMPGEAISVPSQVTPGEALALAQQYVDHLWTPGPENVFHGLDADGVLVHTADVGAELPRGEGWWKVGEQVRGIPYKWGGFDLPEGFDAALRAGKAAGDIGTLEKRRLLEDAVSRHAAGVDCSGYVSRCWKLPRSYSTRELPQLCVPIATPGELRPGDILNKHNAHVRMFAAWADESRGTAVMYEASDIVKKSEHDVNAMLADGYLMWRYRGMK